MFMRFPPCPAMGRPEIGPLWASVEAVFTRERAENGDMPECTPYLRFQAPKIFRVKVSTTLRFSPPTQGVCARRHPQFSPRAGDRLPPPPAFESEN